MPLTKETGRPKKNSVTKRELLMIKVVEGWKTEDNNISEKLEQLSKVDFNEEFRKYCRVIEHVDISEKGPNRFSAYCRWILFNHVIDNQELL